MKKIFDDAKDKNVSNYVVYGKSADSKLYEESTYTTQCKQVDIEDAFRKGHLIVMNGNVALVPVALSANKVTTVVVSSGSVAGTEWVSVATPA